MKIQYISIAGFTIKVTAEKDMNLLFEEAYQPFFVEQGFRADVTVTAKKGIQNDLLSKDNFLFNAKNQEMDFFSIHQHGSDYKLFVYDQKKPGQIQQLAIINKDLNEWKIFCRPSNNNDIIPFAYPLGPLLLYYLTVKSDAVMLHSSGVNDHGKGFVFSGFSGAGKSTMAYLWRDAGSMIINDDRLIIRKNKNEYSIFNTPMFYVDIPKVSPLHSVFLIHHSPENTIKKISGANAVSRVMANCIQHAYNNGFIEHHLEFLTELCQSIPVYEVGFRPDIQITDFIRQHAGR